MSTPYDPLGGPMDMGQDPDRFDPSRDGGPVEDVEPARVVRPPGRLDPAADPDRFTLPGLLGEGAHEEPRDTYTWVVGLLGVLAFLALVSLLFGRVLSAG